MTVRPNDLVLQMGMARVHVQNVQAGKTLPTTKDLLRLCPYMGDSLHQDMRTFADIAARRIRNRRRGAKELKAALRNLTLEGVGLPDVLETLELLNDYGQSILGERTTASFALRCELYAASMNHAASADLIWNECLKRAINADRRIDTFHYLQAALGWRRVADLQFYRRDKLLGLRHLGENILTSALAPWEAMRAPVPPAPTKPEVVEAPHGTLTVMTSVGNAEQLGAKRIVDEFKAILNTPLPLVATGNLPEIRSTLIAEFPWAGSVTDAFLLDIGQKTHVSFRPTVLLGSPGSGKSRYCHRLFSLLGIKCRTYNAGGIADASLGGAARQWNTACPSLPLSLFRQFQTASPGIVLDELDKASTNRTNGSLLDALLAMTEPESAQCWYDPYVQAPINLSAVLWLGTANDAAEIPEPLRDRFRILAFPEPADHHLEALARKLMREIAEERGLHPGWARPLTWTELEALWKVWPGGSVRALRRYLEGVLNVRESTATQEEAN